MLTQEYLKSVLDYDCNTGLFTWKERRSNRVRKNDIAGYRGRKKHNGKTYITIRLPNGKLYQAHRLVFLFMEGSLPPEQVDHKNGDGTDNSWGNLRHATCDDNAKNRRIRSDNKSGVMGVRFNENRGGWSVDIKHKKVVHNLGCFLDFFEAVCARKSIELRFGFHANHNTARPL